MRARNIKPGIYKNEVLGTGDPLLFTLFTGLWALADREGRLEDRPLRIKAEIFPYRTLDVDPLLDTLAEAGMIVRYTKYGTAPVITRVIQIVKFTKHQNPHKNEKESELPEYKADTENSSNYSTTPEKVRTARAESFLLNPESLNPDPPSSESGNGEAPQDDDVTDVTNCHENVTPSEAEAETETEAKKKERGKRSVLANDRSKNTTRKEKEEMTLYPPPRPDTDPELWTEWLDVRKKLKKPLTQRGYDNLIRDLGRLPNFDLNTRLEVAIDRKWQGLVFAEDKDGKTNSNGSQKSDADKIRENAEFYANYPDP